MVNRNFSFRLGELFVIIPRTPHAREHIHSQTPTGKYSMTIAKNLLEPLYLSGAEVLPDYSLLRSWYIEPNPDFQRKTKEVINAWTQGAIVDYNGCPWVEYSHLRKIFGVNAISDLAKFRPSHDEVLEIDSKPHLRGTRVARFLDIVSQSNEEELSHCADVSQELYSTIRNSKLARHRQDTCMNRHAELAIRLRDQRIRMKKLSVDELTGDRLENRTAEFVYLRSPALFPEWVDEYRNGLVVNRQTADQLPKASDRTTNEREMFRLCYLKDWQREWYKSLPYTNNRIDAELVM